MHTQREKGTILSPMDKRFYKWKTVIMCRNWLGEGMVYCMWSMVLCAMQAAVYYLFDKFRGGYCDKVNYSFIGATQCARRVVQQIIYKIKQSGDMRDKIKIISLHPCSVHSQIHHRRIITNSVRCTLKWFNWCVRFVRVTLSTTSIATIKKMAAMTKACFVPILSFFIGIMEIRFSD